MSEPLLLERGGSLPTVDAYPRGSRVQYVHPGWLRRREPVLLGRVDQVSRFFVSVVWDTGDEQAYAPRCAEYVLAVVVDQGVLPGVF